MFRLSHRTMIVISGLVWFIVGCGLLQLGLNLLVQGTQNGTDKQSFAFLTQLGSIFGGREQAAVFVIALALLVGYLKGRYVLGKSANSAVKRILLFPNPSPFYTIYTPKYYVLLALMMGLGMSIKLLGIPSDIRGGIDVAIGAALINGSLVYFQHAFMLKGTASNV